METSVEELGRGTTFAGRYEIVEELGAGGMGRIYRAFDKKLQEDIALKLIRPDIGADRKTIDRFHNEIKIARKIRHKNVCGMYDFHEEGKTLYLTMEFVRGEDLRSLIHRMKVLPTGTAVSIARQIAEGLSEAHKLGIVHRDLKPGNIMIDKDGQAKIMDFGIARSLLGKGLTGEGMIVGTPEYMSPEQVDGKEADQRSDIYALGIILYEMLIGRAPFEGETPFSIANKHKTEPPPIPKKIIPQIPEDLNKLILRCLEKEKSKRHQTADELVAVLLAVEQELPTTDRALIQVKTKIRTSREITVKFTPWKIIISAAIVAVLAIAIVAVFILFKPARGKIDSLAVLPLADLSAKKGEVYSVDGIHDALINELTKIPSVNVIARQSVMRYKDSKKTIPEIARELKVAGIVEGSVVQAKETVRITLNLFEGRNERRIWGPKSFERNASEILSLYGEVALTIAREINAQLMAQDIENLTQKLKVKPKAYELYLQARSPEALGSLPIQMSLKRTLDLLQQAVEIDPNFALGYAWIAFTYRDMASVASMPQAEAFDKAREAAKKAVSLDETLAEAHSAMGLIAFEHDWDFGRAETEYRRATELAPGRNIISLIHYLTVMGRFDEALALVKREAESNPLEPIYAAWILYMARRFDEAIDDATRFIQLNPEAWLVQAIRSVCYSFRKKCSEALAENKKILSGSASASSDPNLLFYLACSYASCGDRKKTDEMIEAIKKTGYLEQDPASLAVIYSQLGDKYMAIAALKQGFESRSASMPTLTCDPLLDPLRDDPGFKALLKKYGFKN